MPTPTTARAILTGFPGYLAWRVCALLLRARPGLAIDALIAPRDRDRAATAARELDHLVPGAAARLRWHPYRPDAPDLGLDPAVTVHSLRVTALTTARERGSDIIDLQDFAGHADPRTTLTYIRSRDRLSKSPAYVLNY